MLDGRIAGLSDANDDGEPRSPEPSVVGVYATPSEVDWTFAGATGTAWALHVGTDCAVALLSPGRRIGAPQPSHRRSSRQARAELNQTDR